MALATALLRGFVAVPLLLLAAVGLTLALPAGLTVAVAAYFISTLGYSCRLKQVPLLDVFVLAGLFTFLTQQRQQYPDAGSAPVLYFIAAGILALACAEEVLKRPLSVLPPGEAVTIEGGDPVELARRFRDCGAEAVLCPADIANNSACRAVAGRNNSPSSICW